MENEKLYTKEENNVVLIVEERGVAAFPIRSVVREITAYIYDHIRNNKPTKNGKTYLDKNGQEIQTNIFKFGVPHDITQKISWVENIKINVEITDYIVDNPRNFKMDSQEGEGSNDSSFYDEINSSGTKLMSGSIELFGKSINTFLISGSVMPILYHELNHSYENFKRLKERNTGLWHNPIKKTQNSDDIFLKYVYEIVYRLFNTTEFKAHYSMLYGELESMKSDDYRQDLKKSEAYKKYQYMKNTILPKLQGASAEKWEFIKKIFESNEQTLKFKDMFINKARFLINDLFKRMGKVASLYYDNKKSISLENEYHRDGDHYDRILEIMNKIN